MVEVAGIEPASLRAEVTASTCLVNVLNLAAANPTDRALLQPALCLILPQIPRARILSQPAACRLYPLRRQSGRNVAILHSQCQSLDRAERNNVSCSYLVKGYYIVSIGICDFARCFKRPPGYLCMPLIQKHTSRIQSPPLNNYFMK